MFRAAVIVSYFLFSLWPSGGSPETTPTARTVDVQDRAFAGHEIAGMKIMNAPCVYGDSYHYELTSDGQLSVRGPIICGNYKGAGGGEEVCYLNPQLNCQSRTGFSAGSGEPYAISESGVKVGDKVIPWVDTQQAMALLPSIEERARAKCDSVLFWQAQEKQQNKPTSVPTKLEAQEGCKPTLVQICASSGGKLASGKDVSILCRP